MACTITSLILLSMFGVIAVGLVATAPASGSQPTQQDGEIAMRDSGAAWWARFRTSTR
jgi:hypothetical protein